MKKLLIVKDLKYSYNAKTVFDDLSFYINKNSINVVIGPNNCGKTTLIKILSGFLQCEDSISFSEPSFDYLKCINFCFLPNKIRVSNKTVLSELKRFNKKYAPSYNTNFSISNILINFELVDIKTKKINELSKVEFIKFLLAVLIIKKPKVLFVDNLLEELNYYQYVYIMKFIKKIIDEYNISILYTTNRLELCMMADKVIFLNNGMCELSGTPKEILEYDNVLSREGIHIPIMIDLSLKLKFYNLVDQVIFEPKEMVEKLWK